MEKESLELLPLARQMVSGVDQGYSCGLENHIDIELGKRFSAAC
jgi:hypothetical protein